jgi:hypothetical protein
MPHRGWKFRVADIPNPKNQTPNTKHFLRLSFSPSPFPYFFRRKPLALSRVFPFTVLLSPSSFHSPSAYSRWPSAVSLLP